MKYLSVTISFYSKILDCDESDFLLEMLTKDVRLILVLCCSYNISYDVQWIDILLSSSLHVAPTARLRIGLGYSCYCIYAMRIVRWQQLDQIGCDMV